MAQSILLGIVTAFCIKAINRGSFIIRYEDKSIIMDHSRMILEASLLMMDSIFEFNYGLYLIFLERSIDLGLAIKQALPYIKVLIPMIKPAVEHIVNSYIEPQQPPVNKEVKRKPAFAD